MATVDRKLTVATGARTHVVAGRTVYTLWPMLRLWGRWLEHAGFPEGAAVNVRVEPGRLVIELAAEPPSPSAQPLPQQQLAFAEQWPAQVRASHAASRLRKEPIS